MTVDAAGADDARMDIGVIVRVILSRWFRIVVITAVLLGATYAVLYFVPRMYESSAGVLVETRENPFSGPATGAATTSASGAAVTIDQVISSQIELIKSRDTLLPVIEQLDLRAVPEFNGAGANPVALVLQLLGRKPESRSIDETVVASLAERLTVVRERDSAIISILVRSTDPQRAADIANAIARAHVKRRAGLSLEDTAETSQWLESEIVKLRERVNEAEQAVADFRIANDLLPGANNTSPLDQQLTSLATQITQATERRNTAQTRAALIRSMVDQGQPIDGLADVQNSVVIQQLTQSRAELQRQLAERSSTLLPNHPTIRALRAQIREIEAQIAAEGRRVASALEAEASVEEDLVSSLQAELARLKVSASEATRDTVALDGLEREAKAQRDILESYLLRYRDALSRSEASSALPDVRVVTEAAASTTPASPKTGLILAAVGFASIALQVGGIIFGELMSGRALAAPVRRGAGMMEPAQASSSGAGEAAGDEPMLPFGEPAPSAAAPIGRPPEPASSAAPAGGAFDPSVSGGGGGLDSGVAEMRSAASVAPLLPAGRPEPAPPVPHGPDLSAIAGDIALGRVRVVLVAAIGSPRDIAPVVEALVEGAVRNGLSVAHVDAGSGRPTPQAGLADLAAGKASFGDIVHRDPRRGRAEVPWGTIATLDRRSTRPLTLIDALSDLYEVVIVSTGRIGLASALPMFAGVEGRLLLVAGQRPDPDAVGAALADAGALGFSAPEIVAAAAPRAEVA